MRTLRAAEWKRWYAEERRRLGDVRLAAMVERAPEVALPPSGAVVFPHTRAEASGELIAAAARAVVRSGADRVLAIGVLHGARERDLDLVTRARSGDGEALAVARRVHGPGAPNDEGLAQEEFSLDAFESLLTIAAAMHGTRAPAVIARYPFLVGDDPSSLPGLGELDKLARDCAVVATTDPLHHGAGYGTLASGFRDETVASTMEFARAAIAEQESALERLDFATFARLCAEHRSDFRDVGPTLAAVLGRPRFVIHETRLVDYSAVLEAPRPTWVAAALCSARPSA